MFSTHNTFFVPIHSFSFHSLVLFSIFLLPRPSFVSVLLPLFFILLLLSSLSHIFIFMFFGANSVNKKKHEQQRARVIFGNECAIGCALSTRLDLRTRALERKMFSTGNAVMSPSLLQRVHSSSCQRSSCPLKLPMCMLFHLQSSCVVYSSLYYHAPRLLADLERVICFAGLRKYLFVCLFVHQLFFHFPLTTSYFSSMHGLHFVCLR